MSEHKPYLKSSASERVKCVQCRVHTKEIDTLRNDLKQAEEKIGYQEIQLSESFEEKLLLQKKLNVVNDKCSDQQDQITNLNLQLRQARQNALDKDAKLNEMIIGVKQMYNVISRVNAAEGGESEKSAVSEIQEQFALLKIQVKNKVEKWSETEKKACVEIGRTKEIMQRLREHFLAKSNSQYINETEAGSNSTVQEKICVSGESITGTGGTLNVIPEKSGDNADQATGILRKICKGKTRKPYSGAYSAANPVLSPIERKPKRMVREKSSLAGFYAEDKEDSSLPQLPHAKRRRHFRSKRNNQAISQRKSAHDIDSTKEGHFCTCGKGFSRKGLLAIHIRRIINRQGGMLQCQLCSAWVINKFQLDLHLMGTHNCPTVLQYKCSWIGCVMTFQTAQKLSRHMKLAHNNQESFLYNPAFQKPVPLDVPTTMASAKDSDQREPPSLSTSEEHFPSAEPNSVPEQIRTTCENNSEPTQFCRIEDGEYLFPNNTKKHAVSVHRVLYAPKAKDETKNHRQVTTKSLSVPTPASGQLANKAV